MKLFRKIENLFTASAFAEAGEYETARSIAAEEIEEPKKKVTVTSVKTKKPQVGGTQSLKGAGSES